MVDHNVSGARDVGRVLREQRKARGLTLETLAGLAHVGTRFLSELERGKETAELGKVLKVLRALGLEVVLRPRGVK